MPDREYSIGLDDSEFIVAADRATAKADQLDDSLQKLSSSQSRSALGQFVSLASAQSGAFQQIATSVDQATGEIYEFADAYDLLPSKIDSVVTAQQRLNVSANQIVGSWGRTTQTFRASTGPLDDNFSSTVKLSQAGLNYVKSTGAASGAAQGFAGRLLTFGRTLDDAQQFQYGFTQGIRGVGNNLIEINPLLGVGAIALGLLATKFGDIEAAAQGTDFEPYFGFLRSNVEGLIQTVGEFVNLLDTAGEKAAKLKAEQSKKAEEDLGKIRDPEEVRRGKAVTDVVERFGGGTEALNVLRAADLGANIKKPRTAEEQREFDQDLPIKLDQARKGDQGAIDFIRKIAGRGGRGGLFGEEITGEIARTSPERVAGAKDREEEVKAGIAAQEEANKAYEKLVADRAKILAGGELGRRTIAGGPGAPRTGEVQAALAQSTGEDISVEMAEAVRQQLESQVKARIAEEAGKAGVAPDQARTRLAAEDKQQAQEAAVQRQLDVLSGAAAPEVPTPAAPGAPAAPQAGVPAAPQPTPTIAVPRPPTPTPPAAPVFPAEHETAEYNAARARLAAITGGPTEDLNQTPEYQAAKAKLAAISQTSAESLPETAEYAAAKAKLAAISQKTDETLAETPEYAEAKARLAAIAQQADAAGRPAPGTPGATPAAAPKAAPPTAQEQFATRLAAVNRDDVAKLAVEQGIKPEDALAQVERAQAQKRAKDALARAEEATPGLSGAAEAAARFGFSQGGAGGASAAVQQFLRGQGLAPDVAATLGMQFGGEAQRDRFGQLVKEQPRSVQTFGDTGSYLNAIQQSVGGDRDTGRETVQELRLLRQFIEQQARQGGNAPIRLGRPT